MKKPFPKLVASEGVLVREVIPIPAEQSVEVAKMLGMSAEEYAREMAVARAYLEVTPEAQKIVADFQRNLDAAGLLDENGMVKR